MLSNCVMRQAFGIVTFSWGGEWGQARIYPTPSCEDAPRLVLLSVYSRGVRLCPPPVANLELHENPTEPTDAATRGTYSKTRHHHVSASWTPSCGEGTFLVSPHELTRLSAPSDCRLFRNITPCPATRNRRLLLAEASPREDSAPAAPGPCFSSSASTTLSAPWSSFSSM